MFQIISPFRDVDIALARKSALFQINLELVSMEKKTFSLLSQNSNIFLFSDSVPDCPGNSKLTQPSPRSFGRHSISCEVLRVQNQFLIRFDVTHLRERAAPALVFQPPRSLNRLTAPMGAACCVSMVHAESSQKRSLHPF